MTTKVYVLTREVNGYEQHGEYFVEVFAKPPTIIQLSEVLREDGNVVPTDILKAVALLEHIRLGGGRQNNEDVWYFLRSKVLK